jgi:hypothetical protein
VRQVTASKCLKREQRTRDPVTRRAEAKVDDVAGLLSTQRPSTPP